MPETLKTSLRGVQASIIQYIERARAYHKQQYRRAPLIVGVMAKDEKSVPNSLRPLKTQEFDDTE